MPVINPFEHPAAVSPFIENVESLAPVIADWLPLNFERPNTITMVEQGGLRQLFEGLAPQLDMFTRLGIIDSPQLLRLNCAYDDVIRRYAEADVTNGLIEAHIGRGASFLSFERSLPEGDAPGEWYHQIMLAHQQGAPK